MAAAHSREWNPQYVQEKSHEPRRGDSRFVLPHCCRPLRGFFRLVSIDYPKRTHGATCCRCSAALDITSKPKLADNKSSFIATSNLSAQIISRRAKFTASPGKLRIRYFRGAKGDYKPTGDLQRTTRPHATLLALRLRTFYK